MRAYVGTVCMTLCLTLPILAQTTPPAASQPQQPNAAAGGADVFIRTAGESGKAEVALAALAQKKAMSSRVRAYAERLHRDHSATNKELATLASAKNVTIPEIPAEKRAIAMRLEKTAGEEFDRAYMTQMVADHRASVTLFERAAAAGDPQVKAFAEKTLPTLKTHLADAEEVQKSLHSSSTATPARGTSPTPGSTPAPGGRGTAPGTNPGSGSPR